MKVAFWIYDEWAFGSIHKALVKEFYKRGIYADLIPWQRSFTNKEIKCLVKNYDVWVTTPGHALNLLIEEWNVDISRIVLIAHGGLDIDQAIEFKNDLSSVRAFGVICNQLVDYSRQRGITVTPKLVQNGIVFENFYRPASESLDSIGYAGSIKWENPYDGIIDFKRGHLVSTIADNTNTPLRMPGIIYHMCMPAFYPCVDTVIVSSHEHEACGLPLMESAAAGRLPMAANVGINADMENPTGIILPVDEKGFVEEATEVIKELKANPALHRRKCLESQEYARQYYDWSKVIDGWIDIVL